MRPRERVKQREAAERIGREHFPEARDVTARLYMGEIYIEVWHDHGARLYRPDDAALSREAWADRATEDADADLARRRSEAARKAVATRRRRQRRRQPVAA